MFSVIIGAQRLNSAEDCRKGLHIRQSVSGVDIELLDSAANKAFLRLLELCIGYGD